MPNRLNFRNLWLTDDSMLHIGAKMRTRQVSEWAHTICFSNNLFGEVGTAAIFSGSPCRLIYDAHPFKYLALKTLKFEQTPMSEGVPYLVNVIVKGCIPNLEVLSLVQVNLESVSAYQVFSLLGTSHVPNLLDLDVSHNPFTGFALKPLMLDVWMCPSLVKLRAKNLDNLLRKDHAVLARAILDGKLPQVRIVSTKEAFVYKAVSAHVMTRKAMRLIFDAETSSEQEGESGEQEGESGEQEGESGEF
jgi:hypothetical protein